MEYLATLYDRETPVVTPGTPEWDEDLKRYVAFGQKYAPHVLGGNALHVSSSGFAVRKGRPGREPLVTDGPFTETNEVVGGYYLLAAESLDEVIDIVREIPVLRHEEGRIEVRPLVAIWTADPPVTKGAGETRYLASIYGPETDDEIPGTPQWEAGVAEHRQFAEKHADALLGGLAVRPVATATTVALDADGELQVSDGPVSSTMRVVGGAYELKAASKQDAVAIVADMPTAHPDTWVEVRPIVELR